MVKVKISNKEKKEDTIRFASELLHGYHLLFFADNYQYIVIIFQLQCHTAPLSLKTYFIYYNYVKDKQFA